MKKKILDLGPPYFFLRSLQNRDFCAFFMKNRLIIENVAEISDRNFCQKFRFHARLPPTPIIALRRFITIGYVLADIHPLKIA